MASSTGGSSSSSSSPAPPPKILLAKPGLVTGGPVVGKFGRGGGNEDDSASLRSRLPSIGSLNLLSDSWDFHYDRFLPFLTENTEFTVIGVIGPPGVGKSTIMNEIYGFDGSSTGMLPPFTIQSEDTKAMAKHCTVGIEPRISSERIILLDTQPVFSPSILAELMRPDGSSMISALGGDTLSSELTHELMGIQLGIFLASVCHILLVVSEGIRDNSMWRLMSTVDLLKHGIPDPSSVTFSRPQSSNIGAEKESKDKILTGEEFMATPVFVHAKVQDQDLFPPNFMQLKKALALYSSSSSFKETSTDLDSVGSNLHVIPSRRNKDGPIENQYETCDLALWKLRDKVLSMNGSSFSRAVSERDWLKNSAKIWEQVKNSPTILEYSRALQSSGMFRR